MQWYKNLQSQIDTSIENIFKNRYDFSQDAAENQFFKAMRYAVEGGGKRIRAILAILAYEYISKQSVTKKEIEIFCGIEMVHAYTLVHDDLPCMDDDILRRGKPTVWKKYSETTAVLVGDALQTLGYELLSDSENIKILQEITKTMGDLGVVRGQVRDTVLQQDALSLEELFRIHDEKTGSFIASSLVIGAILAEADEKMIAILRRLGFLIGRAFQIKDDILDVEGDAEIVGKKTNKDGENGKGIVALVGLEESKKILESLEKEIQSSVRLIDDERITQISHFIIHREK
ncbi:polyprenyl synthetase family protein [Candidatus Gracilibacteria bacterium]|nr:polyprenyl synthetase family protein [Candidatus Gracilibacteria bacterium]